MTRAQRRHLAMPQLGRDIIVIGASAGGVQALQRLLAGLPADLPAAVFVVLHTWPGTASLLPAILARAAHRLRVSEARHGEPIEHGQVYVAPSDMHLLVEHGHVDVVRGPKENRTRPAINPLFRSAASAYRNRVIGVILTGSLDDGTAGLWAVNRCGGIAIAQSDAEFDDMPNSARENVQLDHYVPVAEIPPLLDQLTREPIQATSVEVPRVVQLNDEVAKMAKEPKFQLDEIGTRSVFSCPECNGALWELREGKLEYRCHIGHSFSPAVLRAATDSVIEQSLWSALRALRESAALDDRLATQAAAHRLNEAERICREQAHEKLVQADRLQQFLASLRGSGAQRPDDAAAVGG